ncbi:MAG: adenylate/guanylate cyclase domain-containing protein [Candidatus Cloacimonetes bacterium]|nr:adenylate/guanylate cyclase domain-containing protein [Candidatus Cloacimonadota bacterium]
MKILKFILISLVVFLLLRVVFFTNFWKNLEHKVHDVFFMMRGEKEISDNVVIVEIGDDTFNTLNEQWPFPREYHAKLIENLEKAGASQIIFDIEFTERTNINSDSKLASAIAKYDNIILSGKLIRTEYNNSVREQLLSPISILTQAGALWGTVNISSDPDGFVRRYELFQKRSNEVKLSIGVMALAKFYRLDIDSEEIQNHTKFFRIGSNNIPKVTAKSSLINYFGPPRTFSTYDFADVIDDSTFTTDFEKELDTNLDQFYNLAENFKNKIVLVGLTAIEFHDTHHTPFFSANSQLMPGVEIHANFIETALRKAYLSEFPFLASLLIFFVLTILIFALNYLVRPSISVFIDLALILAYILFSYFIFTKQMLLIPVLEIPLMIIVVYIISLIMQYVNTVKERKFIKQAFGQYIAPELVEELIKDPKKLEYGGVQKDVSVLYCDIVSFTPYTESHTPKETVDILREYLTEMVKIIRDNKGTLDKFVGDEIVAIFGAPVELEDHAYLACKTAFEMREKMTLLQNKWEDENKDPFEIGIGINSGLVTVGNLGSEQIFDYTAIGDNMNAGARIEALTRIYDTKNNIIISESTYEKTKDRIEAEFIDEATVKGKKTLIRIYELLQIHRANEL